MSIWKKWIGKTFGLTDSEPWSAFFGGASAAGKAVTDNTALQLATVWACVRLNSEAVATLPCNTVEKQPGGGRTPVDHPLMEIIHDSPNADMTAHEFWGAMAAWTLVRGNSFAEIVRSGERVVALNLLPADQMSVTRNQDNELRYQFSDRGKPEDLPADQILHVKGFGFGSDVGLSPIRFGVQTLGTAIAADEAAGMVLGNGMMPSGIFSVPAEIDLTDEQRAQLKTIIATYRGSTNVGKAMMMEKGLKFEQLSLNPEDLQMLETRRFHIEDICRFFGTPPIIIGHSAQGQTMWGSGVEAIVIQWLTAGLNPLLHRFESRIHKQLLPAKDRRRIQIRFNREALLQADSAAKIAFLSSAVDHALMSRNEARSKLDLPPVEGGDDLTAQMNLAPLHLLGNGDPRAEMRAALGLEENQ